MTIRKVCNNLGEIFSYTNKNSRPPIDWIMYPAWVTRGINCLFGLPQGGFYETGNIYEYMKERNYNNTEITAILTMLKNEELAFELPSSDKSAKRNFFIPALLSNENTDFPRREEYVSRIITDDGKPGVIMDNREIRFRYPFLHPIVKQVFMVRLCEDGEDIIPCRHGVCWSRGDVRIVMMEEINDLSFYLQGGNYKDLHKAQSWIIHRMEDINKSIGVKNYELRYVFHVKDKDGSKLSKEYTDEELLTFMEYEIEKIPLPGVHPTHAPSISEILTGSIHAHDDRRHNYMDSHDTYNVTNYGTINDQKNAKKPKVKVVNYAGSDPQYSELQDFLKKFLEAQNNSAEDNAEKTIKITEDEEQKIQDILKTENPEEGKVKLEKFLIPLMNAGAAATNVLTAMINFFNEHPGVWPRAITYFLNFLHR